MRVLDFPTEIAIEPPAATATAERDLYLQKCQVDTPPGVVEGIWKLLLKKRKTFKRVVDYGAGDGKFAIGGDYGQYTGFEVDQKRLPTSNLPPNASVKKECAFLSTDADFELCIGNPPFVRHHDVDKVWYRDVCRNLDQQLGFRLDQRSNAFLLFLAKALLATNEKGIVALVIPFEWVSRPAAEGLRNYIKNRSWEVKVYRFTEDIFDGVMTTASLTIIDKSKKCDSWKYFEISKNFAVKGRKFASGETELFEYARRTEKNFAQRGLSPGGQKIFCLTEGQRIHNRLTVGIDVVPCVTTMRHWQEPFQALGKQEFQRFYVQAGVRCWLVKTWGPVSKELRGYLEQVPEDERDNYTCNHRKEWWKIPEHKPADIIYSSAFVGKSPKFLINKVRAVAVGTVQGIHCVQAKNRVALCEELASIDFNAGVVAHSGKLRKIEVGQMNKIVDNIVQKL